MESFIVITKKKMKSNPIKIGLILFIIYLAAQGIYRCNKYDCLNLKKDENKSLKFKKLFKKHVETK